MQKIVQILGGVLAAIVGVAPIVLSMFVPLQTDGLFWTTVLGALGVGGSMVGYPYAPKLDFNKKTKSEDVSSIPVIESAEMVDVNANYHLSERFRKSNDTEGLNLCASVASRLFILHHEHKDEK